MPRAIRHPFPRRADGRPLTIAHRGASAHAPENTLIAFRKAAELGADMVELDVRLTADGVPVISHDPSAARTHGVDVVVAELTADALKQAVPALPTLAETITLAEAIRDRSLYGDQGARRRTGSSRPARTLRFRPGGARQFRQRRGCRHGRGW